MPQIYVLLRRVVAASYRNFRLVALLLACVLAADKAVAQSPDDVTITLELSNVTIEKALKTIDSKAPFTFFYGEQAMLLTGKRVTASFNRTPLREALDVLFRDSGLDYKINQNTITVFVSNRQMLQQELSKVHISGVVTDKELGEPLIGAAVYVKGMTIGKTTSSDGSYSISVPAGGGTLVFSYVGKKTEEVTYSNAQTRINVALADAGNDIEDVVVTGYQKLDKRLSASATTQIMMEEIQMPNVTNLGNMIQGHVPGVTVQQTSGSPNAVPRIRVRGSSTIFGNAAPVWVVDGIIREDPVPLSNDELNNVLYGGTDVLTDQMNENASLSLIGNAISGVNPNDIESITFLKDASATAIYGTRAANGVIVVTTKRGKTGAPSVNYSMSLAFSAAPRYDQYNLMNSKQRIGVSREVVEDGYLYSSMPYNTGYEGALFDYYDNKITKSEFDARVASLETMNTDWFDLLFQNSFSQDYSASISGGTDKTSYYVSLGYNNSQGTAKGDEARQYTFSSNLMTRLTRWLEVDTKLSFADRKSESFYMVNPFDYATSTSRAIHPDEYYTTQVTTFPGVGTSNYPLKYNIFNELNHTGNEAKVRSVNASVGLNADLLPGLRANVLLGVGYSNSNQQSWADEMSYYIATIRGYDYGAVAPGSAEQLASKLPQGGILNYDNTNNTSYTARVQLQYNKTFGKDHAINVMAGYEARSVQYDGFSTVEYGYFPERGKNVSYEYDSTTSGQTGSWAGSQSSLNKHTVKITDQKSNTISAFGTLVYAYKNRYVLNFNVRGDASNRFGQYTNNKFQPVWSVAARWSMAEEEWMKNQRVINDLSFRASYGRQGNVPTSVGPNLVAKYMSPTINRWTGDYQIGISRLPYPNLRWEKTNTINLGVDFSLFDGRIAGTFDYYEKRGEDIIFNLPVAAEYGTQNTYRNGASLKNTGFELAITFIPIRTKDFQWTITPNWSKNTNNISKTTDQKYTYMDYLVGNAYENGRPVNAIYSWEFTGLDPEKGYAQFAHTSRDASQVEVCDDPKDYLVYSGQKDPKISGGLTMSFRYKNFSLTGNFAYAFGNVRRLNFLYNGAALMPQPHENLNVELLGRWRQPGDEAYTSIPGFVFDDKMSYNTYVPTGVNNQMNTYEMYNYSSARIVKGDFFRCRNLMLTWYAPKKLAGKLHMQNLSCSFNVTNPFTICSKRFNGQDPELENTGNVALPIAQTYSLSVNIGF